MIPDFKTFIKESIWSDIQDRSMGKTVRREDVKPQDYEHWWRNIPLDDAPKYKSNELRLYDFLYETIIWKLEKTMNIKKPNTIRIYFWGGKMPGICLFSTIHHMGQITILWKQMG